VDIYAKMKRLLFIYFLSGRDFPQLFSFLTGWSHCVVLLCIITEFYATINPCLYGVPIYTIKGCLNLQSLMMETKTGSETFAASSILICLASREGPIAYYHRKCTTFQVSDLFLSGTFLAQSSFTIRILLVVLNI
jgi:hypothetical protein